MTVEPSEPTGTASRPPGRATCDRAGRHPTVAGTGRGPSRRHPSPTSPSGAARPAASTAEPSPRRHRPPDIPLVPTRRLLTAAFDLLARSSEDMRRASFYVGAHRPRDGRPARPGGPHPRARRASSTSPSRRAWPTDVGTESAGAAGSCSCSAVIAIVGLLVAVDRGTQPRRRRARRADGRAPDHAPARPSPGRGRAFWRDGRGGVPRRPPDRHRPGRIANAILAEVLVETAEVVGRRVDARHGGRRRLRSPTRWPASCSATSGRSRPSDARSGSSGRARGGRDHRRAVRDRSRSCSSVLGLSTGLDLVIRVFDALGLRPDGGPLGFVLTSVGMVALVFATGTLLFTVYALTVAPQVVMFLGLTHATIGLDRVRPAAGTTRIGRRRFEGAVPLVHDAAASGPASSPRSVSSGSSRSPWPDRREPADRVSRRPSSCSRSSSMPRWWASSWTTVIQTSSARSSGSGKSCLERQPEQGDRVGHGIQSARVLGPGDALVDAVQGVVRRAARWTASWSRVGSSAMTMATSSRAAANGIGMVARASSTSSSNGRCRLAGRGRVRAVREPRRRLAIAPYPRCRDGRAGRVRGDRGSGRPGPLPRLGR